MFNFLFNPTDFFCWNQVQDMSFADCTNRDAGVLDMRHGKVKEGSFRKEREMTKLRERRETPRKVAWKESEVVPKVRP